MAKLEKAKRNEDIKKDRKNGMLYADIARKYNISLERARQICLKKEYDGDLKELSLRVRYALNRAGIMDKDQLIVMLDEEEGIYVRNIGIKGLAELETLTGKKLEKYGYFGIRVVRNGIGIREVKE